MRCLIGNFSLQQVLDLLNLLIKYGYYANFDDISKLIPLLVSLLNDEDVKLPCGINSDLRKVIIIVGICTQFAFGKYRKSNLTKVRKILLFAI